MTPKTRGSGSHRKGIYFEQNKPRSKRGGEKSVRGSTGGGVGINNTPKGMWGLRIILEKGPYLFTLLSLLTCPW